MKFGAGVICNRTTWDDIRASIATLEAGRWNSLWFPDHFFPPRGGHETEHLPVLESFTLIAVAAGMTQRLRLGNLVLGNTYRNPALVAKMATTLDQASKGRFTLGIGTAWFEREHEAYGWEFPSIKERSDRLQEACELIRKLFTADGPVDYHGRYYRLDQARLSPGSYQQPHIPIMVGGTGEQRTLRTLAMHGDIMNLDGWVGGGMAFEHYQHKAGVLQRHCEAIGRDPAEIKHTLTVPMHLTDDKRSAEGFVERIGPESMAGPRDYIIDRIGQFADAGVDEIILSPSSDDGLSFAAGDISILQRVEEEIVAAFD